VKKLCLLTAAVFLFLACDNDTMEKETNPFVGMWETPPDGNNQLIFTADNKVEHKGFSWSVSDNKWGLYVHYFGTYTYEGRQATVQLDVIGHDPFIFDIDKTLYKKTNSLTIKDWADKTSP
jgi:hypothetical protein